MEHASLAHTMEDLDMYFDGTGAIRKRSSIGTTTAVNSPRPSAMLHSSAGSRSVGAKPSMSMLIPPGMGRARSAPSSPGKHGHRQPETSSHTADGHGSHAYHTHEKDDAGATVAASLTVPSHAHQQKQHASQHAGELASMTEQQVHRRGALLLGCWVLVVSILFAAGNTSARETLVQELPAVPVMHAATAVAFAFGVALNLLSWYHAVSHERRVLSALLVYVDTIAVLSYLAMASMPLLTPRDRTRNFPIYLMRFAEWLLTCPTLLQWTCLANHSTGRDALVLAVGDAAVLFFGFLATVTPPETAILCIFLSVCAFVAIMFQMWTNFTRALDRSLKGSTNAASLPPAALNLVRWEIVIFWSLFPVLEISRQCGLLSYTTAEGLTCAADYAAKVGLGIIMVNCNLEQMSVMIAKVLAKEAERVQELLYSILPRTVARKLAKGERAKAENHHMVSILFSDIVGFTTISSTLHPEQVMHFLNELFSKFDDLCDKYNVYKVETIGDAYMVASGLPENHPRHADKLAMFALDMVDAAHSVNSPLDGQPVQIRVGMHSGPVMAGVVGQKRPRYCLFGDTVNTASRMESTGLPGRVQVSAAFHDALVDASPFDLTARDNVEVKGKGRMQTFILDQADSVPDHVASNRSSICMEWDAAMACASQIGGSPLARASLGVANLTSLPPIREKTTRLAETLPAISVLSQEGSHHALTAVGNSSAPAFLKVDVDLANEGVRHVAHVASTAALQDVLEVVTGDVKARKWFVYLDSQREVLLVPSMTLAQLWRAQRDSGDEKFGEDEGTIVLYTKRPLRRTPSVRSPEDTSSV